MSLLPSNMLVFAHDDSQVKLLYKMGYSKSEDVDFLTQDVLPRVMSMDVDRVMLAVLKMYHLLNNSDRQKLMKVIHDLPFVKVASGVRKCSCELLDPRVSDLCEVFKGCSVFPSAPYDEPELLNTLKHCGLRKCVRPQEIIDVISSISLPESPSPQLVSESQLCRASAILQYFANSNFPTDTICQLDPRFITDSSLSLQPYCYFQPKDAGYQFLLRDPVTILHAFPGREMDLYVILLL